MGLTYTDVSLRFAENYKIKVYIHTSYCEDI
jgi:hypothetical protein